MQRPMTAHDYVQSAESNLQNKNYDQAISDINKALGLVKEFNWRILSNRVAYLHKIRGDAYYCKDEYDNALTDYLKSLEHENNLEIHFKLGMAHFQKKMFKDAIQSFILAKDFPQAKKYCATAYIGLKEYEVAIFGFSECLDSILFGDQQESSDLFKRRGHAYFLNKDHAKAIENYSSSYQSWKEWVKLTNTENCTFTKIDNLLGTFNLIQYGDLDNVNKNHIVELIETLDKQSQITLLNKCLYDNNPFGNRMWQNEFPYTGASYTKGTLAEIIKRLIQLDPTFVSPVVNRDKNISKQFSTPKKPATIVAHGVFASTQTIKEDSTVDVTQVDSEAYSKKSNATFMDNKINRFL